MNVQPSNRFPKLHNAMWPGLVGKGSPGAEPCLDLDTMLDLTAKAEVNGRRFDGVDIFLFDPHINIDIDDDGLKRIAEQVQSHGFVVGSVVAPIWGPTGGGPAMGSDEDRKRFVGQVRKGCRIAQKLRALGVRPYGVVRIDSACGVSDWATDPQNSQARVAQTFREACEVAEDFGERLAAEGEICWGGMHSWKKMLDLLQRVDRSRTLGFQADMAHTLLYVMGYNAPEDAILPEGWDWSDPTALNNALKSLTAELRPWTIDFHVAQNDGTVKGSGTHDKTGHHCLPNDPNGKLNIAHHAGFWLRDDRNQPTKAFQHICWDGCMFPNAVMHEAATWNDILRAMIAVQEAHGWSEESRPAPSTEKPLVIQSTKRNQVRRVKPAKATPKAKSRKPPVRVSRHGSATKARRALKKKSGRVTKPKGKKPRTARTRIRKQRRRS
jgi:sugar phosphate isomerase/epimerase